LVTETVTAYKQDSDGDYAHTFVLDPTIKDRKAKPTTQMMPILLEWAPMFVDNSNLLWDGNSTDVRPLHVHYG
jgi:hypothetical protein